MTTFHNEDVCRKSSVYNQTGESYFEQLSAYNHMSAHLRRILLARSVVDSRNKKYYMNDKPRDCRYSSRSKSLDKILARKDIIDGIAYDTEHHPIDVLRMSLECDRECRRKKKHADHVRSHQDWHPQCLSTSKTSRRMEINHKTDCRTRSSRTNDNSESLVKLNHRATCRSARSCRLTGSGSYRQPEVDRGKRKICVSNDNRVRRDSRNNRLSEVINETYSAYESSFESASDTSESYSPKATKKFDTSSPRTNRVECVDRAGLVLSRQLRKLSNTVEHTDETKYAKFLYDITQEIMLNGLYTDQELREVFKKHVEMNSGSLDRNRMLSEIYQLKISLNVEEFSDDDEENDIERFMGSGRFATLLSPKPPTPPRILDDNKIMEKLRNHEESWRFDVSRRRSAKNCQNGKNTVLLVDANPEMLITERDVLVTLTEMKLDPQQVQMICKNLQNKSREMALSQTVQVDAEASYPRRKEDRGNSPMTRRTERSTFESFCSTISNGLAPIPAKRKETTGSLDLRDRMTQAAEAGTLRKERQCECQCSDKIQTYEPLAEKMQDTKLSKAEESQTKEDKPEVAIQASPIDSQSRGVITSTSLYRVDDVTMETQRKNLELQKTPEQPPTEIKANEASTKKNKTSSARVESSKTRRESSSERDQSEPSESTGQEENEKMKKKKRPRSVNKSPPRKSGLKNDDDYQSIVKPKKNLSAVERNGKIPTTGRRQSSKERESTELKKSAKALQKMPVVKMDSMGRSKELKDLTKKKLSKDSITANVVDTSENSEITDITEKESIVLTDRVEIRDITDDELASLSEDISEVEESQIAEELSSFVNTENNEQLRIIDETAEEAEVISVINKAVQDLQDSKNDNGTKQISRISSSDEEKMKLTSMESASRLEAIDIDESSNDDEAKKKYNEESSISEELFPTTVESERPIVTDSNDRLKQSKIPFSHLIREEETDEDEMVIVHSADKNSEEETQDKEIRVSDETNDRTSKTPSKINEISEDINRSCELSSPPAKTPEKVRDSKETSLKKKKKQELICGPCCGQFIGKFGLQNDSDVNETPRTSARKKSRETIFREDPMTTTASDISLLKREDLFANSSDRLYDGNAPKVNEVKNESNFDEFAQEPLPWMYVEKELPNEESKLEVSEPRRDTIHRRTSVIRTLRSAMENLRKRRITDMSDTRSANYERFPIEAESSSNEIFSETKKDVRMTVERAKSSSGNSSNVTISPESNEDCRATVHEANSSSKNSSNATIIPGSKEKFSTTVEKAKNSSKNSSTITIISESKENLRAVVGEAKSSLENSSNITTISGSKKNPWSSFEKPKSSFNDSSNATIIPESHSKFRTTVEKTKSPSKNSSTLESRENLRATVQERSNNENSSVPSNRNKKCRPDCRGFLSAQHQPHLYATLTDFCERLDSSSSQSLESIAGYQGYNDE